MGEAERVWWKRKGVKMREELRKQSRETDGKRHEGLKIVGGRGEVMERGSLKSRITKGEIETGGQKEQNPNPDMVFAGILST